MGIREAIDQKRPLVIGIVIGCICLSLIIVFWEMKSDAPPPLIEASNKAFFTDDEVATFVDDVEKIPPLDHNGKQAVRAYVFTCDGGKTKFIGYVERFPQDSKARLEALQKNPAAAGDAIGMRMRSTIMSEVRKPHETNWVKKDSPEAQKVLSISCPNGNNGDPQPVNP